MMKGSGLPPPRDAWNSSFFRTRPVPGHGSNSAHGDAERLSATTQIALVFVLYRRRPIHSNARLILQRFS